MRRVTKKTSRKSSKKPKFVELELDGEVQRVTACPHRQRLCVVKNSGARGGYLILRCSDSALVAWARLKGHACDALEQLETPDALVLDSKIVNSVRQQLSKL